MSENETTSLPVAMPVPIGKHGLFACMRGDLVLICGAEDGDHILTRAAAHELGAWLTRNVPDPAFEAEMAAAERAFAPRRTEADRLQAAAFNDVAVAKRAEAELSETWRRTQEAHAEAWAKYAAATIQPTGTV